MKKISLKLFLFMLVLVSTFALFSCSLEGGLGNNCSLSGHKWDDGIVTTPATLEKEGEMTFTCVVCKTKQNETIPMVKVADAQIYEIDGIKYVNYGSYPQSHVGDEMLIAELNKLTETNDRGYYEYDGKEYAKITTSPCNYGTISVTDKQGEIFYITFVYSDGMVVRNAAIEWFAVEPIKWRIISENSDGSYQLFSEYILNTTVYFDGSFSRNINGVEVCRNNYKYSNIRAWLNGYNGSDYNVEDYTQKGFFDLAFKSSEKDTIIIKEVDNSANTSGHLNNKYVCENTFDKIYLLNYQDVYNTNYGFTNDLSRCSKVTDYAKALGTYWETAEQYFGYNSYWLRSPSGLDENKAFFVQVDGNVLNYYTKKEYYGVRVACNIYLK